MALFDEKILFLDFQTTAHRPPEGEILELAWAVASAREAFEREPKIYSSLVAPSVAMLPRTVKKITGLVLEDLAGQPTVEEAWEKFRKKVDPLGVARGAIHYARFELPFVEAIETALGYPETERLSVRFVCTREIGKKLLPELPAWGIRALAGYFGMSLAEEHRAGPNTRATIRIWRELVRRLEEQGITSWEALESWLTDRPRRGRGKRALSFLYAKEKRLSLPEAPGVYRMLSHDGTVLYVGKATSLKSRVNTYFNRYTARGKKGELLTQVADLGVTETPSALEAALLEADEIKRLSPPYNTQLKEASREITFFSRDLEHFTFSPEEEFPLGPFPSRHCFDSLKILQSVIEGEPWETLFDPEQTPAEWAERIARIVKSSAELVLRARLLCRLCESSVAWENPERPGDRRWILFKRGKVADSGSLSAKKRLPTPPGWRRGLSERQAEFDVATYDRLRIVLTEIRKNAAIGARVWVKLSPNRCLTGEAF